MLFSRKNGTLDSIQGFWCRPMTTQGWFRHNKRRCLWAKSWCRYSQSSSAKFVKTSFDCEMKTCLTGSLKVVDFSKFSELARVDTCFNCLWRKIENIFFGVVALLLLVDLIINDHMVSKFFFTIHFFFFKTVDNMMKNKIFQKLKTGFGGKNEFWLFRGTICLWQYEIQWRSTNAWRKYFGRDFF